MSKIALKELSPEVMKSTNLAELLGKQKKHINEKIRLMFQDKIDGGIIRPSLDSRGYVDEYYIPELESKMFVAKHDINYLEQVIQFWIDKDKKHKIPQNFAEALRLAADQQEQITKLESSNKRKDDYVIASNEASIKAGDIKVSEFCKSTDIIDLGQNKMYQWMREQGLLFKDSCEPIQKYVTQGFFRWLPSTEKYGGKTQYTLYVTARGKVWLQGKYMAWLDKNS